MGLYELLASLDSIFKNTVSMNMLYKKEFNVTYVTTNIWSDAYIQLFIVSYELNMKMVCKFSLLSLLFISLFLMASKPCEQTSDKYSVIAKESVLLSQKHTVSLERECFHIWFL